MPLGMVAWCSVQPQLSLSPLFIWVGSGHPYTCYRDLQQTWASQDEAGFYQRLCEFLHLMIPHPVIPWAAATHGQGCWRSLKPPEESREMSEFQSWAWLENKLPLNQKEYMDFSPLVCLNSLELRLSTWTFKVLRVVSRNSAGV